MRPPVRERAAASKQRPGLAERVRAELETLWGAMLERGRSYRMMPRSVMISWHLMSS
jgi:hypothetical protein